jgi:hypothetical protein
MTLANLREAGPGGWRRVGVDDLRHAIAASEAAGAELLALLRCVRDWVRGQAFQERRDHVRPLEAALGALSERELAAVSGTLPRSDRSALAHLLWTLPGPRKSLAQTWEEMASGHLTGLPAEEPSDAATREGSLGRLREYVERLGLSGRPELAGHLVLAQPSWLAALFLAGMSELQFFDDYQGRLVESFARDPRARLAGPLARALQSGLPERLYSLLRCLACHEAPEAGVLLTQTARWLRSHHAELAVRFDCLLESERCRDDELAGLFSAYLGSGPGNAPEILELFSTTTRDRSPPAAGRIPAWDAPTVYVEITTQGYTPLSQRQRQVFPADLDHGSVLASLSRSEVRRLLEQCPTGRSGLVLLEQLRQARWQPWPELLSEVFSDATFQRRLLAVESEEAAGVLGQIYDCLSELQDEGLRERIRGTFLRVLRAHLFHIDLRGLRDVLFPVADEVGDEVQAALRLRAADAGTLTALVEIFDFASTFGFGAGLVGAAQQSDPAILLLPTGSSADTWRRWSRELGQLHELAPELARHVMSAAQGGDLELWSQGLASWSPKREDPIAVPLLLATTLAFERWVEVDAARATEALESLADKWATLLVQSDLGTDFRVELTAQPERRASPAARAWLELLSRHWPHHRVRLACELARVLPLVSHPPKGVYRALILCAEQLPTRDETALLAVLGDRRDALSDDDWTSTVILAALPLPDWAYSFREQTMSLARRRREASDRRSWPAGFESVRAELEMYWPQLLCLLNAGGR